MGVIVDFLKNLFSNDADPYAQQVKQVEQLLVNIGRTYAGIDSNASILSNDIETIKGRLHVLSSTGQLAENYFALLNHRNDKKRFVIHKLNRSLRLDLWYGTFQTGGPPDLLDHDGVEFYKTDVRKHAILKVHVPSKDSDPIYHVYIEVYDINLIDENHSRPKFKTFTELEKWLTQIKNRLK
jgi:hypothetical protein